MSFDHLETIEDDWVEIVVDFVEVVDGAVAFDAVAFAAAVEKPFVVQIVAGVVAAAVFVVVHVVVAVIKTELVALVKLVLLASAVNKGL